MRLPLTVPSPVYHLRATRTIVAAAVKKELTMRAGRTNLKPPPAPATDSPDSAQWSTEVTVDADDTPSNPSSDGTTAAPSNDETSPHHPSASPASGETSVQQSLPSPGYEDFLSFSDEP